MGFWPFGKSDEEMLAEIVTGFPEVFERAQEDWAKFKLGVKAGLFTEDEKRQVEDWYRDFPKLWNGIRPNWIQTVDGEPASPELQAFAKRVDKWVIKLVGDQAGLSGLGFVVTGTMVAVAVGSFLIASIFGIGIIKWADGYQQEQDNHHDMIQARTEGDISEETLQKYIEAEKGDTSGDSWFPNISGITGNLATVAVIGAGVYFFGPQLKSITRGIKF